MLARIRLQSVWKRSTVAVEVARDVRIGRGVRVTVDPQTHSQMQIGTECSVGEGVQITLKGGQLVMGPKVDLRRDVVLNVAGALTLEGRNVLQIGIIVHCDDAITFQWSAIIGERTTIIDTTHYYSTPDEWIADNTKSKPVVIGRQVWIGAQATIARGVTIGDFAIVAANSLVTEDVPGGHVASGVPAQVVRPVSLPWERDPTS
jgi:acetyltransferase-like isoleucine patch superfamily enzyme